MKCLSCGVAAFLLVLSMAGAQDDATKNDLRTLQGIWQAVSMEVEGKAIPADSIKGFKLTFNGNKGSHPGNDGKIEEAIIKLDPSKKPKAIDMTPLADPGKGMNLVGIYSIDGDDLKICGAKAGGDRPSEFKGGKNVIFIVLKRAAP